MDKRRILIICTGNSARSQMAEALLRHEGGDLYEVFSAGTHPGPVRLGAAGAPVGFLMYPQAETDAGRLDCLDPDNFKYEITSKAS